MFTGLVQTTGSLTWQGSSQVHISCPDLLAGLDLGDSVAVDGLCLTVAKITQDGFIADISPETLSRSTLASRPAHYPVNLEPSLRVGDKLGGHFVSGHIDGIGECLASQFQETAWDLGFRVPAAIGRYVISKGSIAINGISLTVAHVEAEGCLFHVAVIPTTFQSTNLSYLRVGDQVNIEGDMIGKYVEKLVLPAATHPISQDDTLSLDFLVEHGYLK